MTTCMFQWWAVSSASSPFATIFWIFPKHFVLFFLSNICNTPIMKGHLFISEFNLFTSWLNDKQCRRWSDCFNRDLVPYWSPVLYVTFYIPVPVINWKPSHVLTSYSEEEVYLNIHIYLAQQLRDIVTCRCPISLNCCAMHISKQIQQKNKPVAKVFKCIYPLTSFTINSSPPAQHISVVVVLEAIHPCSGCSSPGCHGCKCCRFWNIKNRMKWNIIEIGCPPI